MALAAWQEKRERGSIATDGSRHTYQVGQAMEYPTMSSGVRLLSLQLVERPLEKMSSVDNVIVSTKGKKFDCSEVSRAPFPIRPSVHPACHIIKCLHKKRNPSTDAISNAVRNSFHASSQTKSSV